MSRNLIPFQINSNGYFLIMIFILIIVIAIFIGYYFSHKNRVLRKLKQANIKRIQLVKDKEYIKVIGKVQNIKEPLISPIGKRKCAYYQIIVEEKHSGKNKSWHTIIKEDKAVNFIIESSGERAIVLVDTSPKTKMVYLVKDVKHVSGTWNDPPKYLETYLQSHGKDSTGLFGFNKSIRYREGVIEIGEKITLLGTGHWKESDHTLDRYSSKSLYISGDSENKLIITDDPKSQELKKK
ncbi:hypothetical protein [uncultured Aquimarina sp.]|uniref:hypothetical protein n=1 Tax=uncultured Aquimarina sp. TaxID=575652 RepID=UPI00261E5A84|nr:hypothetical protein [uncultured Aquimarina sp.]